MKRARTIVPPLAADVSAITSPRRGEVNACCSTALRSRLRSRRVVLGVVEEPATGGDLEVRTGVRIRCAFLARLARMRRMVESQSGQPCGGEWAVKDSNLRPQRGLSATARPVALLPCAWARRLRPVRMARSDRRCSIWLYERVLGIYRSVRTPVERPAEPQACPAGLPCGLPAGF